MDNTVKIDALKLESYLADKGLLKTDVSQQMGSNRSFVSNSIGRGYMKISNYNLLCLTLGVDKEEFIKKDDIISDSNKSRGQRVHIESNEQNYLLLTSILKELKALNEAIKSRS